MTISSHPKRIITLSAILLTVILGTSVWAATSQQGSVPLPEPAKGGPPPALADRDGDGLSDDLQAKLAEAQPGDRFKVIVSLFGSGSAAAAQQAVGPFAVYRNFQIIRGFAATMTAAQVRALTQVAGVARIEPDSEVRAFLDTARSGFGVDQVVNALDLGYTGNGVGICVVDTGVDPTHEELDSKTPIPFFDAVNGAAAAYDDHGHGTHVASIAAGDGTGGSNAATYKGVAPDAAVYAAKVLDQDGNGSASDIIAGIEWCAGEPGVNVISLSLGGLSSSDGTDAMSTAANCAADPSWINPSTNVPCPDLTLSPKVVVLAAGNAGPGQYQISSPAAAEQPITVGAVADSGEGGINKAAFSSPGPTADERIKPDIMAPGVGITAAQFGTTNGYVPKSGTSMATPFISGTVALALEAAWQASLNPTPADIKGDLEATAQDWGPSGKDIDWGSGLLDAYAFVATVAGKVATPTVFPTHIRIDDTIPDYSEKTYTFEVTDPDKPIAVTITNGGDWLCTWMPLFFGEVWICLATSYGSDLDAELYDPTGNLVDESTCELDTNCGAIARQETLLAGPPVQTGTWEVRVYPWNGDAADSVNPANVGVDISSGATGTENPNPGNQPPVAVDEAATTPKGTAVVINVLANDTDPEGDTLIITAITQPAKGTAKITSENWVEYTPHKRRSKVGDIESFTYTISDGNGGTDWATVTVTIIESSDGDGGGGGNGGGKPCNPKSKKCNP